MLDGERPVTYPIPTKTQRILVIILAVALLTAAGCYYGHRLVKWTAYDDEGGYLYATWRISLGELPYRDFLTPQLPVFLYPGALVQALTDGSVGAMRGLSLALVLATAALLFSTADRLLGGPRALLALLLFVVQRQIFWGARFFRPEAPMLFWSALGLWLFALGYETPRRRGLLALSGAAMGLAMMSKLFGALPMAGLGVFLLVQAIRKRDLGDAVRVGLSVGAPFVLVVGGMALAFWLATPNFFQAVFEHHTRQGSGASLTDVVRSVLGLYVDFARFQPVYVALAALGSLRVVLALGKGREDRVARGLLWMCQLPTVLAFFVMTRGLQPRHLTYLILALAPLVGLGVEGVVRGFLGLWPVRRPKPPVWGHAAACLMSLALCALALWPHVQYNHWVASWEEHDTEQWASYLQAHTAPGAYVVSDYPGINFFARRPTTPIAAGISRGAASSGQITGAALIEEIEAYHAEMVLLNVAQGSHQFVRLLDYETFKAYVQSHFHLVDRRKRDYRLIEIYSREDLWEGDIVAYRYSDRLALTGTRWAQAAAAPGEAFQVMMRWQGLAPMDTEYRVTLQLMDDAGHVWGLGSKTLVDIDRDTYWDDKGLERALLIPTNKWPVGETTIEAFELPVDLGTPPGEYAVTCRVHAEGGWAGLQAVDASGVARGYDLAVGRVVVALPETQLDSAELPADARVSVEMVPGLRLDGYCVGARTVRPGDTLRVGAIWKAESPAGDAYRLGIALRGKEQRLETIVPLTRADHPTTAWRAGDVWRGQYGLFLPPETPGGIYELTLSLLDGCDAVRGDRFSCGEITVSGRQRVFDLPDVSQPLNLRLGDAITLLGHDLARDALAPGEPLSLTLYWRAEQSSQVAYTVFVHLLDKGDQLWGQVDAQPLGGEYPTTGWVAGEVIADPYTVASDATAPSGTYWVEVGMYDGATGVRAPMVAADGTRLPNDRVLLGPIRLTSDK